MTKLIMLDFLEYDDAISSEHWLVDFTFSTEFLILVYDSK